jgi:hypothetical protein
VGDAPPLDAWLRFHERQPAPFTIPGHKQRTDLAGDVVAGIRIAYAAPPLQPTASPGVDHPAARHSANGRDTRPLMPPPSGRGRVRSAPRVVARRSRWRSARDRALISSASVLRLGLQGLLQPPKLSSQAVPADGGREQRFQWPQHAMGVPSTQERQWVASPAASTSRVPVVAGDGGGECVLAL